MLVDKRALWDKDFVMKRHPETPPAAGKGGS
jgi:hypothetical protein